MGVWVRVVVSVVIHDVILLHSELDSEDVNHPGINLNSEQSVSQWVSTASSHVWFLHVQSNAKLQFPSHPWYDQGITYSTFHPVTTWIKVWTWSLKDTWLSVNATVNHDSAEWNNSRAILTIHQQFCFLGNSTTQIAARNASYLNCLPESPLKRLLWIPPIFIVQAIYKPSSCKVTTVTLCVMWSCWKMYHSWGLDKRLTLFH